MALFKQINTDPEWVDWDKVEHGAEVFRRYSKELYPYFGMVTFNGYALETIAKPLALTGAYTGGSAFGRFLETCRLWTDTTEPGAMRPGGAGRRSAILVRILHSIIRNTLLPHAEWDRARLGMPISQFAMLGTLLTRREQFHSNHLGEAISLFNPLTSERITHLTDQFIATGCDVVTAGRMALGALDQIVRGQSFYLAYGDQSPSAEIPANSDLVFDVELVAVQ